MRRLRMALYTWGDNREQATGRPSVGVALGEALAHGWRAGVAYLAPRAYVTATSAFERGWYR